MNNLHLSADRAGGAGKWNRGVAQFRKVSRHKNPSKIRHMRLAWIEFSGHRHAHDVGARLVQELAGDGKLRQPAEATSLMRANGNEVGLLLTGNFDDEWGGFAEIWLNDHNAVIIAHLIAHLLLQFTFEPAL